MTTQKDDRYNVTRTRWPTDYPQPNREKSFLVTLDCGHAFRFPRPLPTPGAPHWCARCRADTRIATPTKES